MFVLLFLSFIQFVLASDRLEDIEKSYRKAVIEDEETQNGRRTLPATPPDEPEQNQLVRNTYKFYKAKGPAVYR